MILSSQVDGAAIDSTVLEWLVSQLSSMGEQIRIIDTFGPSPIPPWVVAKRVPEITRKKLRKLLLQMNGDPSGRSVLARAGIARFTLSRDSDYDPIRRMARAAEQVTLQAS